MFVHPGCTNSGLRRTRGDLPESVCVSAVCDCSALPSPTMFAVCSLTVKLLILILYLVRSDHICGRLAFPLFGPPG